MNAITAHQFKHNTAPTSVAVEESGEFARRQIYSNMLNDLHNRMQEANIQSKNLVSGSRDKPARIDAMYDTAIRTMINEICADYGLDHDRQVLMRCIVDDCKHLLTGRLFELNRLMDIVLPRFKDYGPNPGNHRVRPVDPTTPLVLGNEEVLDMLFKESPAYVRRRISQLLIEENDMTLNEGLTPEEEEDARSAESTWMVMDSSPEGAKLRAVLNYSPAQVNHQDIDPRFKYVSRVFPHLQAICAIDNPRELIVSSFVNGGINALFSYYRNTCDDLSDIEALDVFSSFKSFRNAFTIVRENLQSVHTRLRNNKPAYIDLIDLAHRWRGLHLHGLEMLIRQVVPLLPLMYEKESSRWLVIYWLKSIGLISAYADDKKIYLKK